MLRISRRKFLKSTGALVAASGGLPAGAWAQGVYAKDRIPPHRSLKVPGVHAYAHRISVPAGQSIAFHVSSSVPYRLSICRLGSDPDSPARDEVLYEFPEDNPDVQPIHPGSYVHVERGLRGKLKAVTLECWVRPWKLRDSGLITQYDFDNRAGFRLHTLANGSVAFWLGTGIQFSDSSLLLVSSPGTLVTGRWHHLVAIWDGELNAIWVNGAKVSDQRWIGTVRLPDAPLRLAAAGGVKPTEEFLDGDLALPVIYNDALSEQSIRERFRQQALEPATGRGVVACWPLTEERGDHVADVSGQRRHGRIINHATWMIGGPSFNAEVPRFADYDPRQDPRRGHAVRFASDDLYDCRWVVTHRYRVPATAQSGVYVGRLRFELEGKECLQHVSFIVSKPPRREKAPILVLCSTNTWLAYSGTAFGLNSPQLKPVFGTGGTTNSPGDPPAYNFYRNHAGGQGTFQIGLRVPWPAAGPYVLYGGPTNYSHLMRAERFAHLWLEQAGYEFDVISDLDLHRDPGILDGYRVLVINGHNEYWSIPMYDGLDRYLGSGGNLLCLSGNSLFWRVSFNADASVIECRKVDAPGDQLPASRRGECWHSQDALRGGLLRESYQPGWRLIGLETLGWNNQSDPRQFGPYHVDDPSHFLFHQPTAVGVQKGDAIGQAPDGGLPRANGHEIDVRLSTLASLQEQPAPSGATMPADAAGMTRLANGVIPWKLGGAAFDYFFRPVKPKTDQGGEMIYWERPAGGRVFNAGSIGSGWALHADPKLQRLIKNVLHHFGVREPTAK